MTPNPISKKTYCFDMDGVICYIGKPDHYADRFPIIETINIMSELIEAGHSVIIHTGRHILEMETTQKWLNKHRVPYTLLQFGKPVADLYIDDKALRIEEVWTPEALKYLP